MFVSRCDAKGRYVFFNQAWLDFARQNWRADFAPDRLLGETWRGQIGDHTTLHLYDQLVERARELGRPLTVPFRCDAPNLRRFMEMSLLPLADGGLEWASRLLRQETRPPVSLPEVASALATELVVMCSWCKKVRVPEWEGLAPLMAGIWVEVEEAMSLFAVTHAGFYPAISHGVCPTCYQSVISLAEST